jgi:CTP-dependent riboflavin kinase
MKVFRGIVSSGFKLASVHLAPILSLIEGRTGLVKPITGTLNVRISDDYIVTADAVIRPEEYPLSKLHGTNETIKLQRCLIYGRKALITKPDTHETLGWGNGTKCLELMGAINFRDVLNLRDGSVVQVEVEGDDEWWAS